MIRRKLLMATAVIASVAGTACSDTTAPKELAPGAVSSASSPRSGALRVTKDCSLYFGRAGDTCTITSSNVKAIEVGTRIIYASDAAFPLLDTDVVLDPPGPGNNQAFGHCALDLQTGVGRCTLSGGTGKFTWIHASVAVSHLGGPTSPNFAWEGTYSYSPRD
jgi:hypothetical protein